MSESIWLSCPDGWHDVYRAYMREHDVPFTEQTESTGIVFVLSNKHDPHSWKLDPPE